MDDQVYPLGEASPRDNWKGPSHAQTPPWLTPSTRLHQNRWFLAFLIVFLKEMSKLCPTHVDQQTQ